MYICHEDIALSLYIYIREWLYSGTGCDTAFGLWYTGSPVRAVGVNDGSLVAIFFFSVRLSCLFTSLFFCRYTPTAHYSILYIYGWTLMMASLEVPQATLTEMGKTSARKREGYRTIETERRIEKYDTKSRSPSRRRMKCNAK